MTKGGRSSVAALPRTSSAPSTRLAANSIASSRKVNRASHPHQKRPAADRVESRFFKAFGNLQWNNSIVIAVAHADDADADEHDPSASGCSTVSFRPAIPRWVAPQQSPPPLHRPITAYPLGPALKTRYPIRPSPGVDLTREPYQNLPTDSPDEAENKAQVNA